MVPMAITRIVTADQELGLGSIVLLTETTGERAFPIFIGYWEASAIERHLKGVGPPRPLTHDLLANSFRTMGARVEKIVISSLKDNTFYARIHVRRHDGQMVEIDSRPSDAMALAVRTDAAIFVEPDVLDQATI
ncbi:MAG: bifunctional nuclease family protein [Planctomycetota bacterium]